MVTRVYGLANGMEVIFSHTDDNVWEITVPWTEDGKYTAEIFAEDEAGNLAHLCSLLFVISGHELQACIVLDNEKRIQMDEKKYGIELLEKEPVLEVKEGGYQVERIICVRSKI